MSRKTTTGRKKATTGKGKQSNLGKYSKKRKVVHVKAHTRKAPKRT